MVVLSADRRWIPGLALLALGLWHGPLAAQRIVGRVLEGGGGGPVAGHRAGDGERDRVPQRLRQCLAGSGGEDRGQVGTDDLGPLGALRVARCATRHTPPDVQPPLTRLPRGDSGLEHDRGGVW